MEQDFTSALERMKSRNLAKEKQDAEFAKQAEIYRNYLNKVASSEEGAFVLRVLLNKCWVFLPDTEADPRTRYERSLLRDLYLTTIRAYLDKSIINKIEG